MKPTVFIHTNHKQMLGALVSRYSLKKNAADASAFDVRFIEVKDFPIMAEHEGRRYRRDGEMRPWLNDDLQSFTPLRFAPPGLMGYDGRAVIMDPDIFAVGDIWELLSRDMQGAAIMCRPKSGRKGRKGAWASSVMLLDCSKLTHWQFERDFNEMFEPVKRDYMDWVSLKLEDPATDLVRRDSLFKKLELSDADVETDDQIVDVLVANKRLLQRPLLVTTDTAIIGRPKERVTELLS